MSQELPEDPFEVYVKNYKKQIFDDPITMINMLKDKKVISDDEDARYNMLRFHAWMMNLIQKYSHNLLTTSLSKLKEILNDQEDVATSYPEPYKPLYEEGKNVLQSIKKDEPFSPSDTDISNIRGIFEKIQEKSTDISSPPPIYETKVFTTLRSILNYSMILSCIKNGNDPSLDYLMNPLENYTNVFKSMFCNLLSSEDIHHKATNWRDIIEHIPAVSQCLTVRGPTSSIDWNKCYICGEGDDKTAYECEHVLYAFLAIGLGEGSGIIQSGRLNIDEMDKNSFIPVWLRNEYANAHRCCNQTKSDDSWVTIEYDEDKKQYVISPSFELVKTTLKNINDGIKKALRKINEGKKDGYNCSTISPLDIDDRASIIEPRLKALCNLATAEASKYKSHFIISMRLKQLIALRRTIKQMSDNFLKAGLTRPPEDPEEEAKRLKEKEEKEKKERIKNAYNLLKDAPSLTGRTMSLKDMSGVSLRDTTSYITKQTNELIDDNCKNVFIKSDTKVTKDTKGIHDYFNKINEISEEKKKFEELVTDITGSPVEGTLIHPLTPSYISDLFTPVIRDDILESSKGFKNGLMDIYNPLPPGGSSPSSPITQNNEVKIHPSIAKTIIEIGVLQVGRNVFTKFIERCETHTGNPYIGFVVKQLGKIVKNTQHHIDNLKGNFTRYIESEKQKTSKQLSDDELDKLAQFIKDEANYCKSPRMSGSGLMGGGGGGDDECNQLTLFDEIGKRTLSGTLNPDYMVLYLETVYGNRGHVLQTTFDELYHDLLEDQRDDGGFIEDSMQDNIINDIKDGIKQISDSIHAKYQQVVQEFIDDKPILRYDSPISVIGVSDVENDDISEDDTPNSPSSLGKRHRSSSPRRGGGSSITRKRRVKHKRVHKSRNKKRVTKHRETIRRSKRRHIHKYSKNKRNRRQI